MTTHWILSYVLFWLASAQVTPERFDPASLSGEWSESINTSLVCTADNLRYRFELDHGHTTLTFLLDRKWRSPASGEVRDRYTATVIKESSHALVIRYNSDAGNFQKGWPTEWELAFVAPGVYRWRPTTWTEGKVNGVVGIRCKN